MSGCEERRDRSIGEQMNWKAMEDSILTTDLCSVFGCDRCPGHARVRDLPVRMPDGDTPPDPDATVLCSHHCHKASREELAAEDLESDALGITVTCPRCQAVQTSQRSLRASKNTSAIAAGSG